MPCVDMKISGLKVTPELVAEIETKFTKTLQETIGHQFPDNLGFEKGSELYKKAHEMTLGIMPGWTWITVSEATWAIAGKQIPDEIIARVHILVLKDALTPENNQEIVKNIEELSNEILSASGKKVHLFVDCIEGEVAMTLPEELFSAYIKGNRHKLLKVPEIVDFLQEGIGNK